MVYVIIPNTIKGFAISYHSDLKYNVEIENNEHFICLRSVLNKKIISTFNLQIYQRVQIFLKYLKRYIAKS